MKKILTSSLSLLFTALLSTAHTVNRPVSSADLQAEIDSLETDMNDLKQKISLRDRIHLGGYGEATFNYNFSSVKVNNADALYEDAKGHGSLDIPRIVLMLGANLGKGWGIETDVQIENCKNVLLDQFWIEKLFRPEAGLRVGYLTLPVGATNAHDDPLEFFCVNRPEEEDEILPCNWHQAGLSFYGEASDWSYEAILIPGLNSSLFNEDQWSTLDQEGERFNFSRGHDIAVVGRVDNSSVEGLRVSLSGYYGASLNNRLTLSDSQRMRIRGNIGFLSLDFHYDNFGWIVRGNGNWGRYSKYVRALGEENKVFENHSSAKSVFSASCEGGYDVFFNSRLADKAGKLYVFGRYDYWQPNETSGDFLGYSWGERQRITAGLNYFPIDKVVVKLAYSHTFVAGGGAIPMLSLGVAYSGQFF